MNNVFKAHFVENIKRTPTVMSFRFIPKQKLGFIPGQFLEVIFDKENPTNKELNKYLSFSSSPLRDYIEVTKRLSESEFSQRLKSLKPNDEVLFKGPLGNCVFEEDFKRIGFLIGGIGITPVISILEYIEDKKLDTDVLLFYSNRIDSEVTFKEELDRLVLNNPLIKIVYLLTDVPSEESCYICARLDREFLKNNISQLKERLLYIFGPPKMVEALNSICLELGIRKDHIKTESFVGY